VVALVVAAIVFAYSTSEVRATSGEPRERALLVTAHKSATPWHTGCGKGDDPRDLTWRSMNPPAGLPATFTQREQCNPSLDPGDVATIVRVKDGDRLRVFVNPVLSYGDAIGMAMLAAVATMVLIELISWARRRWSSLKVQQSGVTDGSR